MSKPQNWKLYEVKLCCTDGKGDEKMFLYETIYAFNPEMAIRSAARKQAHSGDIFFITYDRKSQAIQL